MSPKPKARRPMPPGREATRPRAATSRVVLADGRAGRPIVRAAWIGTALLLATTAAAVAAPGSLAAPALVVALAEFFGGIALFVWAYAVAVARSRTDEMSVGGVFGLAGSAPRAVQTRLFGSLAAEVAIGVGGFAARPRSSLAFGILACMWGLGTCGLWGAKHGAFPPREAPSR